MKFRRPAGVILVLSLLLVMTIAILGRVALSLNPSLLGMSTHTEDARLAQEAADSGLEYALSRLREEPAWRGTGNQVMVDVPGLFIEEQDGNVVGLMTDADGRVSQFRIRFNYQDGDGGGDGSDDPPAPFWVDNKTISINNVGHPGQKPVPVADGPNYEVTSPGVGSFEIPGQSVFISVEGRSGPGIRALSKDSPNAAITGAFKKQVAESCFQSTLSQDVPHAAVMGGADVNLTVPDTGDIELSTQGNTEDRTPRIRSKGSVVARTNSGAIADLRIRRERGEIGRDSGGTPGFVGNVTGAGADLVDESVGDGADFYNLTWDDVAQADDSVTTTDTIRVPAGTYVVWDDQTLHYYDMGFEDYRSYMANPTNHSDPGVVLSHGLPEIREPANYAAMPQLTLWKSQRQNGDGILSMTFGSDTHVYPSSSGVSDFTLMPRSGNVYAPNDNSMAVAARDNFDTRNVGFRLTDSIFSAPGDVRLMGTVVGNSATITSAGDVVLSGGMANRIQRNGDANSEDGLNLYVKGDINVSSYVGETGSFSRLRMSGLTYTWGDFECQTGHPDIPESDWRDAELSGTIVAYGSDPSAGTPGSGGRGNVSITSSKITLINRFSSVAGIVDPTSAHVELDFESTLYFSN